MSRGRGGFATGLVILAILTLIALLSPILATDLPLAARTAEGWTSPAFGAWGPTLLDRDRPRGGLTDTDRGIPAPVPFSPRTTSLRERLLPPGSGGHVLGTDELGRDLLARMIHGTRVSLLVGFAAALFSLAIGIVMGGIAGYFGGWIDLTVSRMIDVILSFPFLILLLTLVAVLQHGLGTIIVALAITSWTTEARLVRGEILRTRETEYAAAAKASGGGSLHVLGRHLLPNAIAPALVTTTFGVSGAILLESAISFLGFGIPLPRSSWGTILSSADDYLRQAWWIAVFPGLAIFLTVVACNLIGEGLRDRLDPRSRRVGA